MTTLQLNPKEQQLKHLLLDAAAYANQTPRASFNSSESTPTEHKTLDDKLILRWAGGWVRDKLLGRQSDDIDVAINCMTGEAFGLMLQRFCKIPENVKKHGLSQDDVRKIHTIAKNPEKSKNLETATCRIFGLDVDLVNLRSEAYVENSRNPQMEFATAEQDARRRDATVNALFYNIHTEEVEDFVGGLADMQARVIRTPVEPFQTFMDDPLRVLRLVRFASRLGFSIEQTVKEYMGNEKVLDALRVKISRERVGVELEKMLKGEHPRDAVRYIHELGLYHSVFTDRANDDPPRPDLTGWNIVYDFLHGLPDHPVYGLLVTSAEEQYLSWMLACVVPFAQIPNQPESSVHSKKSSPLATQAVREGLRAKNTTSDLVTSAWQNLKEITESKEVVRTKDKRLNDRAYFGMRIRRWERQGKYWRLQVLFAMLDDVMRKTRTMSDPGPTLEVIRSNWLDFVIQVQKLDLMDAASIPPLVNGCMLSEAFGKGPGHWVKGALRVCMEWQLRNPQETDPAGAFDEVRSRKEDLGM